MHELLEEYRISAKSHGEGTLSGDYKSTNKAYHKLQKILKTLISSGSDSLLFSLYEDENISVQLWAATHTLELDEKRAIAKLKEIMDLNISNFGMDAKYTVKGWNEGKIKFRI